MNQGKHPLTLNLTSSPRSPWAESTRSIVSESLQHTSQKRKPTSPLSNKRSLSTNSLGNLFYNRIDAKTYTDVTSNGLTSRLVRYGDGGNTNKSPDEADGKYKSMRTSFTKKSPFPSLARSKPELKNPPRNSSLSTVRIAPPEKLIFQPASRSTILRSGSMTMLPIQSKRDDEPLPPSDAEPVTAQSALEKLKETTRKRINNEELDAERIKKQCKEVVDTDGPSPNVVISYKSPVVLKRGREMYGSNQSISPTEAEAQKKKLRTKCNEITGSLSSSLVLLTPKRHPTETNIIPNRLDLSNKSVVMHKSPSNIIEKSPEVPKIIEKEPEPPVTVSVPTSVIKKTVSAPPLITLFNKKFDTSTKTRMEMPGDEDENVRKIQFVKPKKDTGAPSDGIDSLRRVEPNKLKLLLNCLSGAINDESDDVDATQTDLSKPVETPQLVSATSSAPVIVPPSSTTSLPNFSLPTSTVSSVSSDSAPTSIPSKPLITSASSAFAVVSNSTSTTSSSATLPTITFGTKPATTTSEPINKPETTDGSKSNTLTLKSTPALSVPKPVASVFGNVSTTSLATTAVITFRTSTSNVTANAAANNMSFSFGTGNNTILPSPIKPLQATVAAANQPASTTGDSVKTTTTTFSSTFGTSTASSGFNSGSSSTIAVSKTSSQPTQPIFGTSTATNETIPANNTSLSILGDSTLNNISFGSIASASKLFGTGSGASDKPPSYGSTAVPATKTDSTASFTFDTSQRSSQTATGQNVTISQPTNASNQPIFGTNQSTAQTTTQSVFGSNQTSGIGGFSFKSPTSSGGFAFNPNSASNTAPTNGDSNAKPAVRQSILSRLGPAVTTSGLTTATPSKDLFTFSSTPSNNSQPTANATQNLMAFSPASSSQNNKPQAGSGTGPFGQNNNSGNVFGSTASVFKSPQDNKNSIFGGGDSNKPASTFGSNASSVFGSSSIASPTNPPAFGSNNTTSFGSNNNLTSPPSFAAVVSNNTFGAAAAADSNNVFGGSTLGHAKNDGSKPFSFGAASNNSTSVFGFGANNANGSNNNNNRNQTFGSNSAPPPAYGSTGSIFGQSGTTNNTVPQPTNPTSPFGNNNTSSAFAFGSSSQPDSKPFAFGENTTAKPNQTSSFNFSGASQQQTPSPNEPPKFNFSSSSSAPVFGGFGSQNNNNSGNNNSGTPSTPAFNFSSNSAPVFGAASTGSSIGSSTGSPAFNFNTGSGGGLTPATPSASLVPTFSIGTSGSQNQNAARRPMRVASRRLK